MKRRYYLLFKKKNISFSCPSCVECLLQQYVSFVRYKKKGGRWEKWRGRVHLPHYCIVDEGYNHCWHFYMTHSQLTRILKQEEEEEEVWGRKGREAREEKKKETQTDRPTGWQTLGVRDRVKERKKGSRWYRQRNEQVIEVKWEWERKGGATWEESNMGSVQQRYVGKRACYGSPLGLPRQIVCAVSQSVLRSSTAPHGDVWSRQDGIA